MLYDKHYIICVLNFIKLVYEVFNNNFAIVIC